MLYKILIGGLGLGSIWLVKVFTGYSQPELVKNPLSFIPLIFMTGMVFCGTLAVIKLYSNEDDLMEEMCRWLYRFLVCGLAVPITSALAYFPL